MSYLTFPAQFLSYFNDTTNNNPQNNNHTTHHNKVPLAFTCINSFHRISAERYGGDRVGDVLSVYYSQEKKEEYGKKKRDEKKEELTFNPNRFSTNSVTSADSSLTDDVRENKNNNNHSNKVLIYNIEVLTNYFPRERVLLALWWWLRQCQRSYLPYQKYYNEEEELGDKHKKLEKYYFKKGIQIRVIFNFNALFMLEQLSALHLDDCDTNNNEKKYKNNNQNNNNICNCAFRVLRETISEVKLFCSSQIHYIFFNANRKNNIHHIQNNNNNNNENIEDNENITFNKQLKCIKHFPNLESVFISYSISENNNNNFQNNNNNNHNILPLDIIPLANINQKLRYLYLEGNGIIGVPLFLCGRLNFQHLFPNQNEKNNDFNQFAVSYLYSMTLKQNSFLYSLESLPQLSFLAELNVSNAPIQTLKFLKNCPQLRILKLSNCTKIQNNVHKNNEESEFHQIRLLKYLQELNVSGTNIDSLKFLIHNENENYFLHLKKINIARCKELSRSAQQNRNRNEEDNFIFVLAQLKNLEDVNLSHLSVYNDDYSGLFADFPSLKKINVSNCRFFHVSHKNQNQNHNFVENSAEWIQTLQQQKQKYINNNNNNINRLSLNLSNCFEGNASFSQGDDYCTNFFRFFFLPQNKNNYNTISIFLQLTSLHLNNCTFLMNSDLQTILQCCVSLESLNLFNTSITSLEFLEKNNNNNNNNNVSIPLISLNIAQCTRLTSVSLQPLKHIKKTLEYLNLSNLLLTDLSFFENNNNNNENNEEWNLKTLQLSNSILIKDFSPLQHLKKIEKLYLNGTPLNNLSLFSSISNFKHLKYLNLSHCLHLFPNHENENNNTECLYSLKYLEELNIGYTGVQNFDFLLFSNNNNNTKLNLHLVKLIAHHCSSLKDISALKKYKNLKFLDLSHCEQLKNLSNPNNKNEKNNQKSFLPISLEFLDLSYCGSIFDFEEGFEPLKNLKQLKLKSVNNFHQNYYNRNLLKCVKNSVKVEFLDISNNNKIDLDKSFIFMLEHFKNLKVLNISNTKILNDENNNNNEFFFSLCEKCPSLRTVKLIHSNNINQNNNNNNQNNNNNNNINQNNNNNQNKSNNNNNRLFRPENDLGCVLM